MIPASPPLPTGHTAVMASRREALDSADHFPTPPWATRALCEMLEARGGTLSGSTAWEPACGGGHMAGPLDESFARVLATDLHSYGWAGQTAQVDFLLPWSWPPHVQVSPPHWIVTNPPFRLAEEFALTALDYATVGVAMLVRTAWLEGTGRYERLFAKRRPWIVAQFAERVPMVKGRWDPAASTATAYAWVVWLTQRDPAAETIFAHIPPGRREALTRPDDVARYAGALAAADAPAPLLTAAE